MVLIRIIVLHSLIHNVRLYAQYIPLKLNTVSDCLSRLKFDLFSKYQSEMSLDSEQTRISDDIWPMEKIWLS